MRGFDLLDHGGVCGDVVGVELAGVHRGRTRVAYRGHLGFEPVGAARGQHHGVARCQPNRQFGADLAASAEYDHDTTIRVSRVFHSSDYHLR